MPDVSWQKGPLGEEFEKHIGHSPKEDGWTRALANWNAIWAAYSKPTGLDFVAGLSVSQRNSLRLLLEWWNADYEDQEIMRNAKEVILNHAASTSAHERIPTGLNLKISKYHEKLFDLFLYEFFFYGKSTAAPIQIRRQKASLVAACQRFAYSVYSFYAIPDAQNESTPTLAVPSVTARLDGKLAEHAFADYNDLPVGAIIEPCPWLSSEKRKGLPYYLWDTENQKTVVVEDLPENPQYIVVSHTWGRWRIQGAEISISGVPWKVPQNTRFKVEDLPDTLRKLSSVFQPTQFIWFDLLCIPQDRSERAVVEISRQAAIFGAASRAVVWLNDIDDWSGVQAAIQWLAAEYLKHSAMTYYTVQPLISTIEKHARTATHLFEKVNHITADTGVGERPSGWFTSLWTLQESCLRPDMTLCSRDWEVLRLHDKRDAMVVTLDSILALANYNRKYAQWDLDDKMPPAVIEICSLVERTHLDELLEYTPLTALVVGNHRQCTGQRAEAIMSVIGATDWYLSTDEQNREENLVLGKYPIQFLREVQQILGADFFASNYELCCFWDIFQLQEDGDLGAVVAGTLLPFDPLRARSKFVLAADSPERFDHPTTEKWKLADDGRVLMPEVGVVASTEDDLDKETDQMLVATVIGPISEDEPVKVDLPKKVNLHEWMRSIFPDLPKHAICLRQDAKGWSQGVILMQVYENEEPPKTFAKLGDFYTTENVVEPQVWEVNWDIF